MTAAARELLGWATAALVWAGVGLAAWAMLKRRR